MAIRHQRSSSEDRKCIGEFADEYLKRLFGKLNRESREIYAVMTKQEHLDSFKEYISSSYPDIFQNGTVFDGENTGTVLNEINANIPDIVFFCLPVEQQIMFVRDFSSMMNTRLCICIESVQPLISKETESAPAVLRVLHLDELWFRMKRESVIKKTVIGSIFKQKVLEDAGGEAAEQGQSTSASSGGDKTGQSEEQKTEAVSVDEATTKVQKEEDRQSFLKS